MRRTVRIASVIVWSLVLVGVGFAIRTYTYHAPTYCVSVQADGNVAPDTCSDPLSYQINN